MSGSIHILLSVYVHEFQSGDMHDGAWSSSGIPVNCLKVHFLEEVMGKYISHVYVLDTDSIPLSKVYSPTFPYTQAAGGS